MEGAGRIVGVWGAGGEKKVSRGWDTRPGDDGVVGGEDVGRGVQ